MRPRFFQRPFLVGPYAVSVSLDAATGENYFVSNSNGLHSYVIKEKEDIYYADAINKLIKTSGI